MLVLFDHGTPKGLAQALPGHTVHTARSRGRNTLSNGAHLLLTTDRRIRYQQDLRARRIALVVLTGSTKWSLCASTARIAAAIASATPGSYAEVDVTLPPKPRSR